MVLIFIDGPLAEEVKTWPDAPPTYQALLPRRVTVCMCNPKQEDEFEHDSSVFTYYKVMVGQKVALYSKHETDEEAILNSLKSWVVTDLTKDMHVNCRSRRAWQ